MTIEQKILGMIGIAKRGKYVQYGVNLPFTIRKRKVDVVFLASDAASNSTTEILEAIKKVQEVHPVTVYRNLTKAQLGEAIGHEPIAALGILNSGIAHKMRDLEEEITNGEKQ